MITQIILRFEDLPEKDRLQICDNLLTELNTEQFIKDNKWSYKLFYKNGGINKPMIEVKRGWHINRINVIKSHNKRSENENRRYTKYWQ